MPPVPDDAMQGSDEKVPLLQEDRARDGASADAAGRSLDGPETDLESGACDAKAAASGAHEYKYFKVNGSGKMYEYDHEFLLGWRSLVARTGTIILERMVWVVIPNVTLVALSIAALEFFFVPGARRFNSQEFSDFLVYIKVFIALMLGLFVKRCYSRWWLSVVTFKYFLTSIKQLLYTCRAINVREEVVDEIQRLCIASCYVLHAEIHNMQLKNIEEREIRWQQSIGALVARRLLTPAEQTELEKDYRKHAEQIMGVHSTVVWTWIGEVMGSLSSEDNVAPPMYVRLLFLCQDCLAKVEELKTFLSVQIPFNYFDMLAKLVHLANLMMAVSSGLTLGSAFHEIHYRNQQADLKNGKHESHIMRELYSAVQVCFMQVMMLLLQPILYQSFLVIAHELSYPYGDDLWNVPTETYISHMQLDLEIIVNSREEKRRRSSNSEAEKKDDDEDDDDE